LKQQGVPDNPVRFSIIIALYNKARYIVRALDSLAAQTYLPFEIIIVDDGSTDNSRAVTEQWHRQHPELTLHWFIQAVNQGPGACRNKGIEMSKAEYLLFLDADDCYENRLLASLADLIRQQNYPLIVFGYQRLPCGSSYLSYLPEWLIPSGEHAFTIEPIMKAFSDRRFPILVSNVAVSRKALAKQRFDESRAPFEGIDLWFRVIQDLSFSDARIGYLQQNLHTIFNVPDSLIRKPSALADSQLPAVIRNFGFSRDRYQREFCYRIATTWFWHQLSRMPSCFAKVTFFWRYRQVLPLLRWRYRKP
jgi:glycosyltransferase involved in cell wall biosynthesis